MKSDVIGAAQTAYHIVVTDPAGTEMWDTGWVSGSGSVSIKYAGSELQSSTEYTVSVTIKDQDGAETAQTTSTFEMGLLGEEALTNENWISYDLVYPQITDTNLFTIDYDLTLYETSSDRDPASCFCVGLENESNLFMWQVKYVKSTGKIQLRRMQKVNEAWSAYTTDITSLMAGIGITPDNIIGKQLHMQLTSDGTNITTKVGNTADDMVVCKKGTLGADHPLGSVAFRGIMTDTTAYDNIVITGADGAVLYKEDFEQTPLVAELKPRAGSYKVENGQLVVGVGDRVTSFEENITVLPGRSLSETTTYSIEYDFTVEKKSADFCFGFADSKNFVLWQLQLASGDKVALRPHFFVEGSYDTTVGGKVLSGDFASHDYFTQPTRIRIEVDEKIITTYLGRPGGELTEVGSCDITKTKAKLTEIPFKNIAFRGVSGSQALYDNIVVRDGSGNVICQEDFSSKPYLTTMTGASTVAAVTDGGLRLTGSGSAAHFLLNNPPVKDETSTNRPAFRKSFTPEKEVKSAKLYTSGLGVYESYINGQRVGRRMDDGSVEYHELKPGFTQPLARKFYSTYDVTWMLNSGENVLSSIVSTGWWSGSAGGNKGLNEAYLAKLVLTYTDGTQETILTDTTWKTARAAALQEGTAIFNGERYDARVDQSWMLPGYDDSAWSPARMNHKYSGTIEAWKGVPITVRKDLEREAQSMTVYQGVTGEASGYYGTVNVLGTYEAGQSVTLNPGETLLVDFGQNAAGWEYFELQAEAGTTIHVEHGEMLNDGNGAVSRGNDGPEGSIYNANYRKATANTVYITSGEPGEAYHPSHTFYGFRYIEITADKPVTFTKITGQVVTSAQEDTGTLVTSDEAVNQLLSNSRWGMYSNYLSIPTDCPQRDERMGWAADTQNFAEAGCYLGLSKTFLEKWMQDMRDTQRDDGAYPSVAPHGHYAACGYGRVGWADAGIVVPYFLYVMYGDTAVIEENWESMSLFMDYRANNGIDRANNGKDDQLGYGDWLAYESNDEEIKAMLDVSYYAWDALMMSEMAKAIGKTDAIDSYQRIYEEQKAYYQSLYLQEDGTLIRSEQSVNLYALFLDLLPSEESAQAVSNVLISNIKRNGNKLQTGFLGTEVIMHTLTKIGRSDVAYKLLLQHDNPSWLYSVDQGATTIWERWNSYTIANGFGDVNMNSFNHYSYGSVAAWMFRGMAGIGWDAENPGFKHIILAPNPDRSLPAVRAAYDSAYGEITTDMRYENEDWYFDAAIPANTTATVYLPLEADDCKVTVNGKDAAAVTMEADGIVYVETADNAMVFEAVAGTFSFRTSREPVDLARDEAQAAINDLSSYQNTVFVTAGTVDSVEALIAAAAAAVETYTALGGRTEDLENYGYLAGAEAAVAGYKGYLIDTYTIDLDLTPSGAGAGFVFGYEDMDNLYMWQINLEKTTARVRPHSRINATWGNKSSNLDMTSAELSGTTIHMQIAVSGTTVKTYIGASAEEIKLVHTYTATEPILLRNFGPRANCDGKINEFGVYDNIVVRGVNGEVIFSEDFSDPDAVVINRSPNANYDTLADGVFSIGTNEKAIHQYYLLGRSTPMVDTDTPAAAEVDALIEAIGKVTADSKDKIEAARAAYTALTDTAQKKVTKLAVLEAAELAYQTITTAVTLSLTGPETVNVHTDSAVYTLAAENMVNLGTMLLVLDIPDDYLTAPVVKAVGEDWFVITQAYANGELTVALGNNGGAYGASEICALELTPREKDGEAEICVKVAQLAAYLGEDSETFVPVDLSAASVTTYVEYSVYDVNKDGVVNLLDMTRAQRFYGTSNEDADVNGDGEVNVDDLVMILNNYYVFPA